LAVSGSSVANGVSFFLAHVSPGFRVAVPSLTLEMVNAGWQIQPNNRISRTVLLGLLFSVEQRRSVALRIAGGRQRDQNDKSGD
jgi:hypothetical protein